MTLDWNRLDDGKYRDERAAVAALLKSEPLPPPMRATVQQQATALVAQARQMDRRPGMVESFLQQFSLSTPEGLALMGLAEALLRTPDADTRDRLIAEKISTADWASHLGQSDSLLVNASTWGLMLTGRLIDVEGLDDASGTIRRLAARVGEPIVRAAVAQAVRIMGEQFVLGRTHRRRHRTGGQRKSALLIRHAGRRRPHRGRCRALMKPPTPRPSPPSARARRDRSTATAFP